MSKVEALRKRLQEEFTTVSDAHADKRCHDVAEWVLRGLMEPEKPGSVTVPDPDALGGEIVRALCQRFGVA